MSVNPIYKRTLNALLLALFLSTIFSTANAEKDRKGPPKGKPPKVAFTVCTNQAEKSSCSFNAPDGNTIEGTCKVSNKSNESLVCRPSRAKHKGKRHMKRD